MTTPTDIPQELRDVVIAKSTILTSASITLDFPSHITWDLRAMVGDVVDWLNDRMVSATSKVGTLSSPQFLELTSPSVDDNTRTNFQLMIYAISIAYTQIDAANTHPLSNSELNQIGSLAGHGLLAFLDEKLKPRSLKHCSEADLHALFLLIIGTILAVGYIEPDTSSSGLQKPVWILSPAISPHFYQFNV